MDKIVREAFEYRAGGLIWRKPPKNHMGLLGKVAGGLGPKGYMTIQLNGKKYRRSQLVFLYHNGRFARPICDHINRNRTDDRIENLREATRTANARNHGKISVRATASGRFQARLGQKVIGTFATFEQAKSAYLIRRRELWQV